MEQSTPPLQIKRFMKIITSIAFVIAGCALCSCGTARSIGDAAGSAVRATGNAVGNAATGAIDTASNVGGAVSNDLSSAGRVVTGN